MQFVSALLLSLSPLLFFLGAVFDLRIGSAAVDALFALDAVDVAAFAALNELAVPQRDPLAPKVFKVQFTLGMRRGVTLWGASAFRPRPRPPATTGRRRAGIRTLDEIGRWRPTPVASCRGASFPRCARGVTGNRYAARHPDRFTATFALEGLACQIVGRPVRTSALLASDWNRHTAGPSRLIESLSCGSGQRSVDRADESSRSESD